MLLLDRVFAALAGQLGEPSGLAGRVVGRLLDRGNRSVVTAAVEATGTGADAVVADVGFGGGVGLDLLLARAGSVHGVEMSVTMLADARSRFADEIATGRLQLHEARMEHLPFQDDSLDAVISTNTIYFVDDLNVALRELHRVLRPAGRLVLGVGDPATMAKMPFTKHGFRLRPIADIVAALRAAGFADIDDRRVGHGPGSFHLLVAGPESGTPA